MFVETFDPNPNTRITIDGIKNDAWYRTTSATEVENCFIEKMEKMRMVTRILLNGEVKLAKQRQAEKYQWLCHLDPESQDVFYENIKTFYTTWNRPVHANVKPHWIAHLDRESNELYYENLLTAETTWNRPVEFSDPNEEWFAAIDYESGRYYYDHVESNKTQWECPDCFKEKGWPWRRHFDPNAAQYVCCL